ncbi:MAG: uroporphyrinogen-III synthase [Actinomycetota bacterium]|nr:uroporphyrinogen-III synthase [Actinomycetota bacterium]
MALSGWRVLIGRTAGRSAALIRLLAAEGAQAQAISLIDIVTPTDSAELDAALMTMAAGDCEWVAFTSVNAVGAVIERAAQLDLYPVVSAQTRVAAVGPATARALQDAGIAVDLVPAAGGSTADLAAAFPTGRTGETVVLPRADISANILPDALRHKGYQVHTAVAYRTVSRPLPPSIAEDLAGAGYQAVVVTSPSGVPALLAASPADSIAIIAIGLPTARALSAAGLPPTEIAAEPTDHHIVAAVIRCPGASSATDRQQGESTP